MVMVSLTIVVISTIIVQEIVVCLAAYMHTNVFVHDQLNVELVPDDSMDNWCDYECNEGP